MKRLKVLFFGILIVGLFSFHAVQAHEIEIYQEEKSEVSIDDTEEVVSDEAGITTTVGIDNGNEKIPSRIGIIWFNIKEYVFLTLTFDQIEKAKKEVRFAKDRIMMAEAMLGKVENDSRVQARAEAMIKRADELLREVSKRKDMLLVNKELGQSILEEAAGQLLRWEEVIDGLDVVIKIEDRQKLEKWRQTVQEEREAFLMDLENEEILPNVRENLEKVKRTIYARRIEAQQIIQQNRDVVEQAIAGDEHAKEDLKKIKEQLIKMRVKRQQESVGSQNDGR